MRLRGVDIPQELIDAQRSGMLVVFAGAGVSMPAPSSYPSFKGLADQIAGGHGIRKSDEPLDQFLGRLLDEGTAVHKRAKEILSSSSSSPNQLHTDSLRLFENAMKVRLVTTNFDRHFTTASKSIFEDQEVEVFCAPALPLGNSFSGLIYLHGSVDKDAGRMVLTDRDFGRAYLTDGWATRFLQRLFVTYTVAFIGYGHNDTVINYLARGLPPATDAKRRFAFVPSGEEDRWNSLGVVPVPYPRSAGADEHAVLAQTLTAWADLARCRILDHEQRIRTIVENPVPAGGDGGDDLDYLSHMLRDTSTAQFFTRYARSTDWLRWIENRDQFAKLFQPHARGDDMDLRLATWFADHYASKHPTEALAVVRRRGEAMGAALSIAIAQSFFRTRPPSSVLGRWIPLLIKHRPRGYCDDFFDYMLHASTLPDDSTAALLLFDHLTEPEIILTRGFLTEPRVDDDDVDFEISEKSRGYWLDKTWQEVLKPNLNRLADGLLWIVGSHLEKAYLLLDSCGKTYDGWDRIGDSRESIDVGQGAHSNTLNVLIDAARDVLLWYVANRPPRADAVIAFWFSSRCRILKRLALFGISKNPSWSPERKLSWILDNNTLYAKGTRREVFGILNAAYPSAAEPSRTAILNEVENASNIANIEEEWRVREIYSTLYSLSEMAPDCPHAKARLLEMKARRPELELGDRPPVPEESAPPDAAELISKPPADWLEFFASYRPQSPFGPSRGDLLRKIGQAAMQNLDWGINLLRAVSQTQDWNSDLLRPVVGTWVGRQLNAQEWAAVLNLLIENERILPAIVYDCCNLLENGSKNAGGGIPLPARSLALDLAQKLWPICRDSLAGSDDEEKDWVFVAINNAAGWLAEFWLRTLSGERQEINEQWAGIPERYKTVFGEVLHDDSYASGIAGLLLASHLHILFSFDEPWAVKHLIPLLKQWDHPRKCLQAWHGYLWWGRWTESSLSHLLPCYENAVPFVRQMGKARHTFSNHLAGIATFSSTNPIEHGWLRRFLNSVSEEDRVAWADGVRSALQQMKEIAVTTLWQKWLRDYWQDRIQGVPVLLSSKESSAMAHWTPYLGPVFSEAALKVSNSPPPNMEHEFVYFELAKTQLPEQQPESFATLLAFLLSAQRVLYDMDTIVAMVRRASVGARDKSNLSKVCEELARLEYPDAGKLRDSLESSHRRIDTN